VRSLRIAEYAIRGARFGPKREEVAGDWRKLHNKEIHNLCASPDVIRVMKSRRVKWIGHVACIGKMRNAYEMLVGKAKGKRPLERRGNTAGV
jgi:hypothetical protein